MTVTDVLGLFGLPFTELVYRAAAVHRGATRSSAMQRIALTLAVSILSAPLLAQSAPAQPFHKPQVVVRGI